MSAEPETPQRPIDTKFLSTLRGMSLIEGMSTLVLFFIAMPLKYMANMPKAVSIAGSIHGFLFVGLVLLLMLAISRVPITRGMAMMGFLAAIVPFGPFIYDRWLAKQLR